MSLPLQAGLDVSPCHTGAVDVLMLRDVMSNGPTYPREFQHTRCRLLRGEILMWRSHLIFVRLTSYQPGDYHLRDTEGARL